MIYLTTKQCIKTTSIFSISQSLNVMFNVRIPERSQSLIGGGKFVEKYLKEQRREWYRKKNPTKNWCYLRWIKEVIFLKSNFNFKIASKIGELEIYSQNTKISGWDIYKNTWKFLSSTTGQASYSKNQYPNTFLVPQLPKETQKTWCNLRKLLSSRVGKRWTH